MENTIKLLKREFVKQSRIKLDAEREKATCIDTRFIQSYSNRIEKASEFILELNTAVEILRNWQKTQLKGG